jgi:oligoendopeptidase F
MAQLRTNNMIDTSKIKTEWDLTKLMADDSDSGIDQELKNSQARVRGFIDKWKVRSDYLEDPKILRNALDEYEDLVTKGGVAGNAGYYIGLKSSLQQDDPIIKARENKIEERALQLGSELDFFVLRISRIPEDQHFKFLDSPALEPYRHFVKNLLDNGKYMLSEAEERIITLLSPTAASNWVRMTSEFITSEEREVLLENGTTEKKNFADLLSLLSSPQIAVRESSANAINSIFDKNDKFGEAEINSVLTNKKTNDFLRGFTRPDQARHISDDVESETVDLLIDVVSSNSSIVHRYYQMKAKLLGLPKLRYFERNILYQGMDKKYKFDEAVAIVDRTMTKLDPSFAAIFQNYLLNGQIDVFTKKGKTSSEFCTDGTKEQPGYVLLNFGGQLEDVSTIAHEMGHAINNELIRPVQKTLNSDVSLCLAETASTFFEDFALDDIASTLSDEEKFALQIFRLDNAINTVFRQIACYKFELDLHSSLRAKGFLSTTDLGQIFSKHMSNYCGPAVEMAEGTQNWWLHWSHIRSFFYVYSYAFGHLVSKYMQNMVRQDYANIERVKDFLSAGSSKSPKEILAAVDIDINSREFWQNGVDQIKTMLDTTEEIGRKLGKI